MLRYLKSSLHTSILTSIVLASLMVTHAETRARVSQPPEVRTFKLTRAVTNPPNLNIMKDTDNPNDAFTATGTLVIDDGKQEVRRQMRLCLSPNPCLEKSERYSITGYTEGTGTVLLRDMSNGNAHNVVFIWNYIQLGLLDTLPNQWERLAGTDIFTRWEQIATTPELPTNPPVTDNSCTGRFNRVQENMSPTAVIGILGEPSSTSQTGNNISGMGWNKVFEGETCNVLIGFDRLGVYTKGYSGGVVNYRPGTGF